MGVRPWWETMVASTLPSRQLPWGLCTSAQGVHGFSPMASAHKPQAKARPGLQNAMGSSLGPGGLGGVPALQPTR